MAKVIDLDLDLLNTFVAVADAGSFTNAAPYVGRSQSAVSMQIQRLEQMVGKPLLLRTPKAVLPNAAGKDLLGYARRLLKLSDEAWVTVTRQPEAGTVRLGVPDDYAASLLPKVLRRFATEYPQVMVELVCEPSEQLNNATRDNEIDLAIVTRLPGQPIEVLRRERLVWVASPTHAAGRSTRFPSRCSGPAQRARTRSRRCPKPVAPIDAPIPAPVCWVWRRSSRRGSLSPRSLCAVCRIRCASSARTRGCRAWTIWRSAFCATPPRRGLRSTVCTRRSAAISRSPNEPNRRLSADPRADRRSG